MFDDVSVYPEEDVCPCGRWVGRGMPDATPCPCGRVIWGIDDDGGPPIPPAPGDGWTRKIEPPHQRRRRPRLR
jgi:hypothetical protein